MPSRFIFFLFSAVCLVVMPRASFAGYSCSTPTNCIVTCSNFSPTALSTLKGTDWVTVPYDTGACYFHNKRTRQDQGELPLRKHLKRIKKLRL